MTADRLLRLYPRAWRERYGEEFLELVGQEPLRFGLVVNIVAGALDARMSRQRPAIPEGTTAGLQGGAIVMNALRMSCRRSAKLSRRDSFSGSAVILGVSLFSAIAGVWLKRAGYDTVSLTVLTFGFPVSMLVSMPFTYLKGQPLRTQAAMIGVPMVILVVIAWMTVIVG